MMTIERQLLFDLEAIKGILFTCPGCNNDIFMSRDMLISFYRTQLESPCPTCQLDDRSRQKLERHKEHFRYLADIVGNLTDFKDVNLRLVVEEK